MPIGLSAQEKLKTIPGQETPARINVGGVTPEQEQMVQNTIGDIAPEHARTHWRLCHTISTRT